MKGDAQIVKLLNEVLTTELTSINRYFLHARMFKNWGFEQLNGASYKKSIKDMKQSDDLIERILFLEGLPNLQKLNPLRIGENPVEMLTADLAFQEEQIKQLRDGIKVCEAQKDFVSRGLLEEILEYEEDFLDWLETQDSLVKEVGDKNYLQSQM